MQTNQAATPSDEFHRWLQNEFTTRLRTNSRYSVRAFARLLEMEPSSVSQLLAGKRRASPKLVARVCGRLSARPEVVHSILQSAKKPAKGAPPAPRASEPQTSFIQLAADTFAVMADWHHYAILELTFTKGFKDDPAWISEQLGVHAAEIRAAIDRLLRLGLLEKKRGRLRKRDAFVTNYSEGMTGSALKELQRQIIGQALAAIDQTAQDLKDITSMTMAIDPARLPEAKERIRQFRRELCRDLSQGSTTRVYNLAIQFFPVSGKKKG